jgi:transposase-like protein
MAATADQRQRGPRRPVAEKRRIVELTLRAGTSIVSIAREHGVHENTLIRWRALYRAGKLDLPVKSMRRVPGPAASATFIPVSVVSEMRKLRQATGSDAIADRSGILQIVLASGATLRIEAAALDATLVCALVAQLQR